MSHNTMSSFFSSTDNNDDKNGVYFSAVVGKLNNPMPELVWRFNIGSEKRTASMDDVFETPNLGKSDPAWLDKVEVKTYSSFKPGQVGMGQRNSGKGEFGSGIRPFTEETMSDDWIRQHYGAGHRRRRPADVDEDGVVMQRNNDAPPMPSDFVPGPLGLDPDMDLDDDDTFLLFQDQYIASTYGEEVAEAKSTIEENIGEVEGADEVVLDLIKQLYAVLSSEGQMKLATEGI